MQKWQVIVEGYQQAQAAQLRIIADLRLNGALVTRPVAQVAQEVHATLLPLVPVQTGTLQAAQSIILENGGAEAVVTTGQGFRNPVGGVYASTYVYDVVPRKPFYEWAFDFLPDMSDPALSGVQIVLDSIL